MIFNYYEEYHKNLSLSNYIEYYNLDLIICNDIIKIDCEMEKVNYKTIHEMDLDSINYELEEMEEIELNSIEEIENLSDLDISEIEYNYNYNCEYYQYYIINSNQLRYWDLIGYDIFYCEELNLYYIGVGHWGTSWNYILTNIPLIWSNEKEKENRKLKIDFDYIMDNLNYDL